MVHYVAHAVKHIVANMAPGALDQCTIGVCLTGNRHAGTYSLRANDRYLDQVRSLRRELAKGDGRVAYFYPPNAYDPTEIELARDMALHLLMRDGVGALYGLDSDPAGQ